MRRGWKALLAVSVFASLGLAGCGQTGTNNTANTTSTATNQPVTLNALFMQQAGYSQQNIEDMTNAFEKAHPNIHVNLTFVPYESLHDKTVTALASGGAGYDTVLVDTIWTPEFARAGFLMDITDKIPEDVKSDAYAAALNTVGFNGKYYGLPWIMDTKYFYYNKKMLQEAGIANPPRTWDEVIQDAKVLKQKGIVKYPIDWSWSQAEALICDYATLVSDFGGQILDGSGKLVVNQGGAMKALNFMVDSLKLGLSNPASTQSVEDDVRKVMSQGQAAFSLNWTYAYALENDKKQSAVAGQIGVSPLPGTSAVPYPAPSVNGAMGIAIAKNTAHPNEALEYVQYLASKEVENKYAALSLPFYKSSLTDPAVVKTSPDMVKAAQVQFGRMINRPGVVQYQNLSHILQVQIQKALLGQESPQQAMNEAVKQWNDMQNQ
jgi:multiple sugar transport system substrate-binding protein